MYLVKFELEFVLRCLAPSTIKLVDLEAYVLPCSFSLFYIFSCSQTVHRWRHTTLHVFVCIIHFELMLVCGLTFSYMPQLYMFTRTCPTQYFCWGNHNDIQFSLRVLPLNIKILLQYWLCVHSQDLIEGFILNAYRWPVLKFTNTFVWISLRYRLTDAI